MTKTAKPMVIARQAIAKPRNLPLTILSGERPGIMDVELLESRG
jgi:hypothetical protein